MRWLQPALHCCRASQLHCCTTVADFVSLIRWTFLACAISGGCAVAADALLTRCPQVLRAGLGMLYALAMGACSMIYAVTLGQAILYAYRIGPSHTKVRRRRSLEQCLRSLLPYMQSDWAANRMNRATCGRTRHM